VLGDRNKNSIKRIGILLLAGFLFLGVWYCVRFYPQQQMPIGREVCVLTPEPEYYQNDCLHPCIRSLDEEMGRYVMTYSPYYQWNNKVENPIISFSSSWLDWNNGRVLTDTPQSGYNSDPNVFVSDTTVYAFWRACGTPLCTELGKEEVVLGSRIVENETGTLADYQVFISNDWQYGDVTQSPVLVKKGDKYRFYAVWYEYEPMRKNRGIAIWEGTSLSQPDFYLSDTVAFDNPLVCDKLFQRRLGGGRILFFPIPKRYDLWHFDLFEYRGRLYMVSCAEKDDNIMLSVSEDWYHFKTLKKPLVNNHFSENFVGYRQYYYKPTALVQNDTLFLFYTANSREDSNRNQLFVTKKLMSEIK